MALQVTTGKIPENAIPLTRSEAASYQWKQIKNWPKQSDVWPFKWGVASLGFLASATGLYMNNQYRIKLKLRHHGLVGTMLPMLVAPAMFATTFHIQMVTTNLFVEETKCPLCLQNRAALIQLSCGIAYPVIMSPIANFVYANRHGTYKLPYWSDFGETLRLWIKFTRPWAKNLIPIAIVQTLAAGIVTYCEADKLYKIKTTIMNERKEHEMANFQLANTA